MRAQPTASIPEWVSNDSGGDLFCSGLWFRHFLSAATPQDKRTHFIQTSTAADDGRLALALQESRGDAMPFCRLLDSMSNYYSCGFGPIGNAVNSQALLRDLVQELASAGRAFDGIRLGPLRRETAFAAVCEEQLAAKGYRTFWTLAFRNWYAPTEGLSYAQYLERVPSSFPGTSEKRRQAFLRKGTGSISITTSETNLEFEMDAYTRVYDSSWKVPEPFPQFVPGLIRLAAREGWLRLGVARVGSEPAAAQIWFVVDGRALIYKVAYDERFAKLSAGSILTTALLDHVIGIDRVREVDFLSGDDPYKAKWMFARRDWHTLWAFNVRRWRGLLAALRESLAQRRDAARQPIPTS